MGGGGHPLSLGLDSRIHTQAMAEQLAENYHNTWGRKKKQELEAKGERPRRPCTDPPSPPSPRHRLWTVRACVRAV